MYDFKILGITRISLYYSMCIINRKYLKQKRNIKESMTIQIVFIFLFGVYLGNLHYVNANTTAASTFIWTIILVYIVIWGQIDQVS